MGVYKTQSLTDYTSIDAQMASAVQKKLAESQKGRNAYDQSVIKTLEQYLDEQVTNNKVDIDANLALLKFYLIYPESLNAEKVAKVLVKAIMAFPSTSFTGATAMISEKLRENENVKNALLAGFLLQSCAFEDFWKTDLTFAKKVNGFTDAVRAFIIDTLSKSHEAISSSVLKAKLGITDKDIKQVVTAEGWTLEGDVVKMTLNEENQMRPKKVQEKIEFDDVLKVIHTLSR